MRHNKIISSIIPNNESFNKTPHFYCQNNLGSQVDDMYLKINDQDGVGQHEILKQAGEKYQTIQKFQKILTSTPTYCKKQSVKNSTAKYRQKKKIQLKNLQQSVKQLEQELVSTEKEVQQVKCKILNALQNLSKTNQKVPNENVEIYNELENIISRANILMKDIHNKQQANSQRDIQRCAKQGHKNKTYQSISLKDQNQANLAIDLDKINLLLDTLKYRIGASGKQRQTKLVYIFKSLVNTIFPALYRYMLFANQKNVDIFYKLNSALDNNSLLSKLKQEKSIQWLWTNQLLEKTKFQSQQSQKINSYSQKLQKVYNQTIEGVNKLSKFIERIKQQALKLESVEDYYREVLHPLQSALWIIFSQKHKYKKQILLDSGFGLSIFDAEDMQQQIKKQMGKAQCRQINQANKKVQNTNDKKIRHANSKKQEQQYQQVIKMSRQGRKKVKMDKLN